MFAPLPLRSSPLIFLALLVGTGCPPDPVFDDELGLQAVSVEPGSMAGTWAQKHSIVNTANLPVIGEQDAGGESYLLVEREVLDDGSYAQTTTLCGGRLYDVGGTSSFLTDAQWRNVPAMDYEIVTIDEELGTFELTDHIEMWSYDMDDPKTGAFPDNAEEANAAPYDEFITDGDSDGNPGMTLVLEGFAQGEAYFIQRKNVSLRGVIVGEDEHKGLVSDYLYETVTIGSNNELLENQLERVPHEDPKQSWYQEVRVDDGMDCDGVEEFIRDGGIPRLNPFL